MVWIFIWDAAPSKIYVWWNEVASVWAWDTKVRPTYTPRTFTISWTEQSNMSSWWTYSDDAAWLTAWSWDFDDFFWYSAVLLNTSGAEAAEMTQSWWVFTGAMTTLGNITSGDNVMIKFPVRWIKMTKSWSVVTLSITEELDKAGYQYYAFQTWTLSNPWTPKDAFYLWAYEWYNNGGVLKSWSWRSPTVSQTMSTFCTQAKANWTWYNIIWFYQRMYIEALYMMKYWNPNNATTVWKWYIWWSSRQNTWATNNQTSASYWTSSATTQAKLFWLEDFWGNICEWIWWCYWDNNSHILYTQLSWWSWTSFSWWESTGDTFGTTNWYCPSSIVWTNKSMFSFNWTVNNGNFNTYYSWFATVFYWFMISSSMYSWSTRWWIFTRMVYYQDLNYNDTYIGSRLMYL